MSILSRYKIGQIVFDHWKIVEVIGEGSEGKTIVFKITRTDSSWGESALKVIPLIREFTLL